MKIFTLFLDFLTSFIITAGGAFGIALYVSKGAPFDRMTWIAIAVTGGAAGAKAVRMSMGLPPLSNGNLETLKRLYSTNPPKPNEETETKP